MIEQFDIDKRVEIEVRRYWVHALVIFLLWIFFGVLTSFNDIGVNVEPFFKWYVLSTFVVNFILICVTRLTMGKFPIPLHNLFHWGREYTYFIACAFDTKKRWGIIVYTSYMLLPLILVILFQFFDLFHKSI